MAYGDIPKLDAHQKRVIGTIIKVGVKRGQQKGLSPREIRMMVNTAIAVGYTESRFRNLPGGDRDSQGWRQERKMYYDNPRNLVASVNRFYDEYFADADPSAPLGVRAQAVQQSGTPNVWDSLAPLANRIRKDFQGRLNLGRKFGGMRTSGIASATAPTFDPGGTKTDFGAAILDNLLGDRQHQSLFQTVLGATEDPRYTTTTPAKVTPGKVKRYKVGAAGPGDVMRVSKDGWKGAKSVGSPLAAIAKEAGLKAISEKRSTRNTASGGVSDHYEGNPDSYAWDLSNGSAPTPEMDRAAIRIMRALGVKYDGKSELVKNVTKKINGRTYRFQVLYRTNVGGNHHNHIHVGVDRVDTPG
jgi:hypothetical protein